MSQHLAGRHIADGINAGFTGPELRIRLKTSVFHGKADIPSKKSVQIRLSACCQENLAGTDRPYLSPRLVNADESLFLLADFQDLCLTLDSDSFPSQFIFQDLGNFVVHRSQ